MFKMRNSIVALLWLASFESQGSASSAAQLCASPEVLIVGAGFSGMAAAKELQDMGVTNYRIIESTNRVGGRVSSVQPPGFGGVWIEEGATWLIEVVNNPVFKLMQGKNKTFTLNNFRDFKMFEYDPANKMNPAKRLNMDLPNQRFRDFNGAARCVNRETAKNFDPSLGVGPEDEGYQSLLSDCGWSAFSNIDFALQWYNVDYEFSQRDTSTAFHPVTYPDAYFVSDQDGGYQAVATAFAKDEGLKIDYSRKVTKINYDYMDDPNFKVGVDVTDTNSACDHYLANYVILTVPVGILEKGLTSFEPALAFNDGPLTMGQYVKIHYKFASRMGPRYKNEFLFAMKPNPGSVDNNDHCLSWQNLDAKRNLAYSGTSTSYLPGENIWLCTLTTEAFEKLLKSNDGKTLSATQIDTLMQPLRQIFPENATIPYKYYYPDWHLRESTGYGAYSNWKIGYTIRDYYEYYGGGPIDYCKHNGCDSDDVWRLHISGTASCFEEWELVHGAYFAGQRSARYVMAEMGMANVDTDFVRCDDFLDSYVLPPSA